MGFLEKLFRIDARAYAKIRKKARPTFDYEDEFKKMTDAKLKEETPKLKQMLANGASVDDILPEAFAASREAARRTIGQYPYPVQVFGATVLNEGDVAEMKTGEGKTLTATMAVYLNALEGKGTHVVTVNQYLASRDADWMGQIYRFMGLSVGINSREKNTQEKQNAYKCDITYSTNDELGFDYLRDNMATSPVNRVLRRNGLHYAIVDEADSILVDESRTPLIISGGSGVSASSYEAADRVVKSLRKDEDFTIDIKKKVATLTDEGINKIQAAFGIQNLFSPKYADLYHRIQQALKANFIFARDTEYMVADNEILLIDSFTGRVMKGREYSDGLQQALQAKEHVEIKPETITVATITYQNFFRLYDKLSGMTGTAKTEEEEFRKIYNMRVVPIPTNRPIARFDDIDSVYGTEDAKYAALIADVKDRHAHGQPILIGTTSVEKSEIVDELLTKANIPHDVLNAKNHAREAGIIAQAGQKGAVTIATNMAGRGTDIKLGRGVAELVGEAEEKEHHYNGLAVLGTERNESRRIDNQLRGRSGRQGDPGYSKFYVCIKDELLQRFSSDTMLSVFQKMGDQPVDSKMLTKAITSAQKKVEGQNFDTRKSLLDYDEILRQQREVMYAKRDKILFSDSIFDTIPDYFNKAAHSLVSQAMTVIDQENVIDSKKLCMLVEARDLPKGQFNAEPFQGLTEEEGVDILSNFLLKLYGEHKKDWSKEMEDYAEKTIALTCIDKSWTRHIDTMAKLRDAIWLRSYANSDPLQAYTNEGYSLFGKMQDTIADEIVYRLLNVQFRSQPSRAPSTTVKVEDKLKAIEAEKREQIAKEQEALKEEQRAQAEANKKHEPMPGEESNNVQPVEEPKVTFETSKGTGNYKPTARDIQIETMVLLGKKVLTIDIVKTYIKLVDFGYLGKQELSLLIMGGIAELSDADRNMLKERLSQEGTPVVGPKSFESKKEFEELVSYALNTVKTDNK